MFLPTNVTTQNGMGEQNTKICYVDSFNLKQKNNFISLTKIYGEHAAVGMIFTVFYIKN
jgi:carboxyl-terminal processing protease